MGGSGLASLLVLPSCPEQDKEISTLSTAQLWGLSLWLALLPPDLLWEKMPQRLNLFAFGPCVRVLISLSSAEQKALGFHSSGAGPGNADHHPSALGRSDLRHPDNAASFYTPAPPRSGEEAEGSLPVSPLHWMEKMKH